MKTLEISNSTVRKYKWISENKYNGYSCTRCEKEAFIGYIYEIYELVVDVPGTVEDNRLMQTVFICKECYMERTVPNG